MSRSDTERLIDAGAIVLGAIPAEAASADAVTARRYEHPALDERVVVRLVPATLGAAEDLAMEFLGFTPTEAAVVGSGQRQALGFPAWALVHDPANGHHALNLVKEIERLSRLAKSRPGNATTGFEELAVKLAASVPHFLPTFYEQAGRAFVAADNTASAATMFGRAREAERVYALPADEDRLRDVFLEFAFNGALTAKSLTQHARGLADRAEPAAAYELFLRICLERVAGGLAPYAGMPADLRRLAKAASRNAGTEDERVLRALLDLPSLSRAPLAFWKAYVPVIVRLAKRDVDVRSRLLDLFPAAGRDGMEEMWLDLLRSTGAVAGLVEVADRPETARPRGGATAWLANAAAWRTRGWRSNVRSAALLELIDEMAPRLRAERQPLDVIGANSWRFDLDLLDLCLALELDVTPTALRAVPLHSWIHDGAPGRRDLATLARTGWLHEALLVGVDEAVRPRYGAPAGDAVADRIGPLLRLAGGRQILGFWLTRLADDAESGALPAVQEALGRLAPAAADVVLAVAPAAAARLAKLDLGRALARTLRIGLLDELTWPALEQTAPEFLVKAAATAKQQAYQAPAWMDREAVGTTDAWPAIVLTNPASVAVVGPDGVLLRHEVRVPARSTIGGSNLASYYADDQVLIAYGTADGARGYWSGRPQEVFDIASDSWRSYGVADAMTLPLPGGGRTRGGRPQRAGDRSVPAALLVVSDGRSWWRHEPGTGWREYDPLTGSGGRRSRPAFFEAALTDDGAQLLDDVCRLAPVPPGLEASPLGTADGMLGWRAVRLTDGSRIGESVGGATVHLTARQANRLNGASPAGSLQLPGGGPRVGVLARRQTLLLWDGDMVGSSVVAGRTEETYALATPLVPPLGWWHAMRPRDDAGSVVLRAVTEDQGRALVAAAAKDARAAVRKVLPGITDPQLVRGVAGVVQLAVSCATSIKELPAPAASPRSGRDDAQRRPVPDRLLAQALSGLAAEPSHWRYGSSSGGPEAATAVLALRAAVGAVTTSKKKSLASRLGLAREAPTSAAVPSSTVEWSLAVGGVGAIALRASMAATPDDERTALLAFLEAVADTPLAEQDGRWREVRLLHKSGTGPTVGAVLKTSGGAAVVTSVGMSGYYGAGDWSVTALEHTPHGAFGAIPGFTVRDARVAEGWGGAAALRELLELVRRRGPAPWRPEAVEALAAATGLSRAEAALLLAGLPRLGSYEHNFLPKHTRETLELKVAEAASAVPALKALPTAARLAVCGLAMPDRPADLWDHGPDVAAVASAWVTAYGRRAAVDEAIVAELDVLQKVADYPAARLVQGLGDPARCDWLTIDKRWTIDAGRLVSTSGAGFDGSALVAGTAALLWLAYRLPSDDALRASLPRAFDALRQRMSNHELLVSTLRGYDVTDLRLAYGHPPVSQAAPRPNATLELGAAGLLVDRDWSCALLIRPARLTSPAEPLLEYAKDVYDPATAALRALLDPGVARLVETLSDVAPGWRQDPLISAPALVPVVSSALGVEPAAARLYLQLLALPDPTDANVRRWNGWSAAELKRAAAPLLDAGALVAGKRQRAGRTAFLPGAWVDLKAPFLPIEAWKTELLGYHGDGRPPLGVTAVSRPVGEIFTAAWERVDAGDGPRLATLETGRGR